MTVEEALQLVRENLKANRDLRCGVPEQQWRELLNRYSSFVDTRNEEGYLTNSSIHLNQLQTLRPHLHLMASNHEKEYGTWGSFWDQFGGGFSCLDNVLAGKMTSYLDTNYVPTAPGPQDARTFYIHEKGAAWPVFPLCGTQEPFYTGFTCEQGLDSHLVRAERSKILAELKVCVHPDLPLELWRVRLENKDSLPRVFRWFGRVGVNIDSYPFYYSVPRVVCEGIIEDDTLVFLNHDKDNKHPRQAFFMSSPRFDGFDMMGEVFDGIGARGALPAAVLEGCCRDSLGLQPYAGLVAAVQFDVSLASGGASEWTCIYGACPYPSKERAEFLSRIRKEILRLPREVFSGLERVWNKKVPTLMIKTPDAELDRYFNVWSRYQARNQSRFTRALDKVGYRDVLQDLLGTCDFEPAYVRTMLTRTLQYQLPEGPAIRQFEKFRGGGHDMRMYMDSSSWIPDLLVRYIKETGDLTLLDEEVPFFDMAALQPDESNCATVYEHALRAVRLLVKDTGHHGLCKIGYGDWNDALSRIGGKNGVSAWLSCACVYAAKLMVELAGYIKRHSDADEMRQIAETMTHRINEHAWDGKWYIYAIDDRGKPIGSNKNLEGKIHLNVNTWALFTGVAAAAGREAAVWDAIAQLETPLGHRLLAPSYTPHSRTDVGRIADTVPGMFENGSIYTHGEAFYLFGLIVDGKPDICYRELQKTVPSLLIPDIVTGPRHQQSNFTVGPDHPNSGTQPFSNFTGSVPWYRRTIERMLGVYADFDGLVIAPCVPEHWTEYEVYKVFRGRRVRVRCHRETSEEKRVSLNGRNFNGKIPLAELREDVENKVEVIF